MVGNTVPLGPHSFLRAQIRCAWVRSTAFAKKCMRMSSYSEDVKYLARKINIPIKMDYVRIVARAGDQLLMNKIEAHVKELTIRYTWYNMYSKIRHRSMHSGALHLFE